MTEWGEIGITNFMSNSVENYLVLARKYRPRTFADLKGQDALVQTLTNAIENNRLHHAYVLTGIRGVGKTTTARIIAKALNCDNGPSVMWDEENDPQVKAITNGTHVDVLEFDAASHRGVEEISDLFEGVAYAPVQGRRKVYIIDEVHMLSKHAFNALLKTLEEPPSHVSFIFATTEVHKIPVTVLSRCQRFDLKRIPVATLADLYSGILAQENIKIDDDALQMIARAADGSARDGLSLLDQAIALSGTESITTDVVSDMLGLADRARVAEVLEALTSGNAQRVLTVFDELYALGQDPVLLLTDCMHMVDTLTRLKVIPDLKDSKHLTELEKTRLAPLAEKLPLENLARLYQMLLTAVKEARAAERPFEAMCMAGVRMAHLASLPPISQLLGQAPEIQPSAQPIQSSTPVAEEVAQPIESAPSPVQEVATSSAPEEGGADAPWDDAAGGLAEEATAKKPEDITPKEITVATWADVIAVVKEERPSIGAVLEQQGRFEGLEKTVLSFALDHGLHKGEDIQVVVQNLLKNATNKPWEVHLKVESASETVQEQKDREKQERIVAAKDDPLVQQAMETFPNAEIIDVLVN